MNKATIIEAQSSNTQYEKGTQPGILGRLSGPFADYINGTRNGERIYTEKLWDDRVFGSADVQEALKTKTLFGELDHPEGDRCETLAKNAAITITKLEKKPEEGIIYGEAEILDTPSGRILKTLADSGAKLGISSRGIGEEIYEEGKTLIDPETYDFITFDVVVTPANEKARLTLTEGKERNALTESFHKEVNEAETENQLDQIKTVATNIGLNEVGKIIEAKIAKMNKTAEEKEVTLTDTNKEILKSIYKENLARLEKENAKLTNKAEYFKLGKENLKQIVESMKVEQSKKLKEVESKNLENILNVNKVHKLKLEKYEEANKETTKTLKEENKKLRLRIMNDRKERLEEARIKEEKYNKVLLENKKLSKQIKEQEAILNENKELKAKLEANKKKIEESKLVESDTIKTLKEENTQLRTILAKKEESINKMNKLPFMSLGNLKGKLDTNIDMTGYSQDDIDLFNALTGK